jgi:alkaline phosphatase
MLAAGAFLALSAAQVAAQTDDDQLKNLKPAKYVFLFIGDGMSLPQRMMAEEFSMKTTGKGLTINAMPQQSYTKSSSANSFITDSAASGTAIACGEKTNNQRLGVAPDGKRKLESVAEVAKKNGRAIGILTSITINHATPAAFYAHNESRDNYYDIGKDLVNSDFDYFGGGGLQNNRSGDNDLYKIAESKGYTVAYKDEVPNVDLKADKLFVRGHNGALPNAIDRPEGEWAIADYTKQCIDFLVLKDKPFFVMVEGGNIDHHGHGNDAAANLRETIDFDKAVTVAMDFAKKHPNDTLVVVTGDHETGGMTLGFANTEYSSYIQLLENQKCSGDEFKNKVNRFADGILGPRQFGFPGRRNQENQENQDQAPKEEKTIKFDDIKPLITENFGLVFDKFDNRGNAPKGSLTLTRSEQERIEEAFNRQFPDGKRAGFGGGDAITNTVVAIFDNKASIGWTSGAHTALPVDTSAYGVNSQVFSGMYENSDIAKKLKAIVSVPVK